MLADHANDGLLREIDEELRQEHYAKLWKRYGNYVVAAAVLLVLGVAGFQGWRAYDAKVRLANGETYALAERMIREGRPDEAVAAFAGLAADGQSGYALLSRFQQAAIKANQNRPQDAVQLYADIAGDTGVATIYRNVALILGAYQELETSAPASLANRVSPLITDKGPWRHNAREVTALAALRAGDRDKARDNFRTLSEDVTAPAALRSRAGDMLAILGS